LQQAQRLIGIAGQFFESEIRNLPSEIIAGHVFHLVRFVEHHCRIFRQYASEIVLLERQVGKEQMVIHDDQIGLFGPLLHGGQERSEEHTSELQSLAYLVCRLLLEKKKKKNHKKSDRHTQSSEDTIYRQL